MCFGKACSVVLLVLISAVLSEKCITPNNEEAECVSLYLCPILIKALAAQQNASIEFVQKSNCGGTVISPMVCCGTVSSFTTPTPQNAVKIESNHANKESLLPSRKYCGYQHADDYVHAESGTSIDEFPWLANMLFESNENRKIETKCGGTLISNRYVLTVAHCANSSIRGIRLVGVRLGEYNVTAKTDCIGQGTDFFECADPVQEFGIEKKIIHPEFNKGRSYANDIALIRLNKTVIYSDYVRPICLPTSGIRLSQPGDTLRSTGWGTNMDGKNAETKKKILLRRITNEECLASQPQYQNLVTENQFCTKGIQTDTTELSCAGDSGSPIMFSVRNQWHQEGMLSFGPRTCYAENPDVHTRVINYLDWIKENIEP